ncbi:GPI10 [Symbiodinium microadriaticum]|nr:GPI10 [Symbiodinium microadriaticum]
MAVPWENAFHGFLVFSVVCWIGCYSLACVWRSHYRQIDTMKTRLQTFTISQTKANCCERGHVDAQGRKIPCDKAVLTECMRQWFGSIDVFEDDVRSGVAAALSEGLGKGWFPYPYLLAATAPILWGQGDFVASRLRQGEFYYAGVTAIIGLAHWLAAIPFLFACGELIIYKFRRRYSPCLDAMVPLLVSAFLNSVPGSGIFVILIGLQTMLDDMLAAVLWAIIVAPLDEKKEFGRGAGLQRCNDACLRRSGKAAGISWPLLGAVFLPQAIAAVLFCLVHQRGAEAVMSHLRSRPAGDAGAFFLTHCHATPFHSFLHREVPLGFLDCSPGQSSPQQRFFQQPQAALTALFPEATPVAASGPLPPAGEPLRPCLRELCALSPRPLPEVFVVWASLLAKEEGAKQWLRLNGYEREVEIEDGIWSEGPYGVELWPRFEIYHRLIVHNTTSSHVKMTSFMMQRKIPQASGSCEGRALYGNEASQPLYDQYVLMKALTLYAALRPPPRFRQRLLKDEESLGDGADKNRACGWATPLRVAAPEGNAEIVRLSLEATERSSTVFWRRRQTATKVVRSTRRWVWQSHQVVRICKSSDCCRRPVPTKVSVGICRLRTWRWFLVAGTSSTYCSRPEKDRATLARCR